MLRPTKTRARTASALLIAIGLMAVAFVSPHASAVPNPVAGAVFTTDAAGVAVDANIYDDQGDVYLNGGPKKPGAAGLPDGTYYVRVTAPDGTLLGTSVGAAVERPVTVVSGAFADLYQLSAILIRASDGQPGYDATANPGGEYKVWVSTVAAFTPSQTKTDNFKVRNDGEEEEEDDLGEV